MNICEFCGKEFYSKYTLKTHQQTAKACVQLKPLVQECFECDGCRKQLHSKSRFDEHVKNCKEQKDILIEKLREELAAKTSKIELLEKEVCDMGTKNSRLETKIEFLEKQVTDKDEYIKTISALIQKPKNQKPELEILNTNAVYIDNCVIPSISADVIRGGYRHIVKCIVENYLKNPFGDVIYKCIDPSRKKFQYRSDSGVETDVCCMKLKSILEVTNIKTHCIKLLKENQQLCNIFLESGEYGYITNIFTDESRLSLELAKYLC